MTHLIDQENRHPTTCKCRGLGYILIPHGMCNCGSGEGCSQHDEFWKKRVRCDGQEGDGDSSISFAKM
jgi:hypothetical protein